MQIIQIVKRFGLVGGMEEYVFRLAAELVKFNYQVIILCEQSYSLSVSGVKVVELGQCAKPRWMAHYEFSRKVSRWISENPCDDCIIHSHERQSVHHVTTFHTTPFNMGKFGVLKFLSFRNFFYEKLEKRELFSDKVKAIVPVSNLLGEMIKRKHPKSASLHKNAIHPGVFINKEYSESKKHVDLDGGTLGFIGKEWKRKGLPKVIEIWRELKRTRPKLKLHIAGVSLGAVAHLLDPGDTDIEVLGLIKDKESFYQSIDLLIHPAKREAFGMVISEALSMGVPVLCSSECGAAECIGSENGLSLPSDEKLSTWVGNAEKIISENYRINYEMSWEQVASKYHQIYKRL